MTKPILHRPILARVGLVAAAVVAMTVTSLLSESGPAAAVPPALLFAGLLLLAVVGSLHQPSAGTGLGLGSMALAPAGLWLGAAATGAIAGLAVVLLGVVRGGLPARQSAARVLPLLANGGRFALAGLAGALVLRQGGSAGQTVPWIQAAAVGAYLFVAAGLGRGESALTQTRGVPGSGRALLLDAAGWVPGLAVAWLGRRGELAPLVVLVATAAALLLEAERQAARAARLERRVRELEAVARASRRLVHQGPLAEIAERVRDECRSLVPFEWFHFSLRGPGDATGDWHARPDGLVELGEPSPPPLPPPRPGIHRRSEWQLVTRELKDDEFASFARLTLWCDPRQVEAESLGLLDHLLPQLATSVHRALLRAQSERDPLTGVADRRILEERLRRSLAEAVEDGRPLSVVMCDIDHFKQINDTLGHAGGDRALVDLASFLHAHCREGDLCCRYGGEEFVLVLEGIQGARALGIAERLRATVEGTELAVGGQSVPMTVSVGVASFPALFVRAPEELLQLADAALYEAKRRGRNRCLENLGDGRFADPAGDVYQAEEPPPERSLPKLFA